LLAVGGSIRLGSEAVAQQVDLEGRITDADWVWTGEGRFDPTTREGKLVAEVIRVAALRDRPVTVIAGQVVGDALRSSGVGQVAAIPLVGPGVSVEDAMARPTQHLERVGRAEMARLLSRLQ
jgi:glycerate kinase